MASGLQLAMKFDVDSILTSNQTNMDQETSGKKVVSSGDLELSDISRCDEDEEEFDEYGDLSVTSSSAALNQADVELETDAKKSKSGGKKSGGKADGKRKHLVKPPYSYIALITMSILQSSK